MRPSILICNWSTRHTDFIARPALYDLCALLQKEYETYYVEAVSHRDVKFPPRITNLGELPGFYYCPIGPTPLKDSHPAVLALVEELSPDLLFGVDFGGLLCLSEAARPDRPLIYLSTGSNQARSLLESGRMGDLQEIRRYFRNTPPVILHRGEQDAVAAADLIIANSPVGAELLRTFFPDDRKKVLDDNVWFAEWTVAEPWTHQELARPFSQREIDVLLVATDWARVEKNFPLVQRILERTGDLKVSIIGNVPSHPPGVQCEGFVGDRTRLFAMMGNSRVVACPSSFDTAPGILFEGSAMGCNVVASRNCGNWRLCHPDLLVDRYNAEGFADSIGRAVEKKYPDRLDLFLEPSSYALFKEMINGLEMMR